MDIMTCVAVISPNVGAIAAGVMISTRVSRGSG